MDTLKAFDILRDGGFDDREARGIVRAMAMANESVCHGRDPNADILADVLSEAGFEGKMLRGLARALRDLALLHHRGADVAKEAA